MVPCFKLSILKIKLSFRLGVQKCFPSPATLKLYVYECFIYKISSSSLVLSVYSLYQRHF